MPCPLYPPGERAPSTHWIGVGPRTSMEVAPKKEKKIPAPAKNQNPAV